MTTRPTTLVESDQLAQAAASILQNEDFVPKGKRWPFARTSKAHRDYEKAVEEITTRRRDARTTALERKSKKARSEAEAVLERARAAAQSAHDEKLSDARKPYDEVEARARSERDAAIAAANLAYQHATETANRVYKEEAATLVKQRDALIAEARTAHDAACAAADEERKVDLAQIAKDLKTIAVEGPMRMVEDRESWPAEERKKALIGIVDMAGADDVDSGYADLCLRNVAGYVFQDRYLKPDAQHHRLMDERLLEALVDLAQRSPVRRPLVVKYMSEIVTENPGHTSPGFIKSLTELYVLASSDTQTVYAEDAVANEAVFETMRAHIADTLKLTPRRSQVPPAANKLVPREPRAASDTDDLETPVRTKSPIDPEITADVNVNDLIPIENEDVKPGTEAVSPGSLKASSAIKPPVKRPPPLQRGPGPRIRTPEGSST